VNVRRATLGLLAAAPLVIGVLLGVSAPTVAAQHNWPSAQDQVSDSSGEMGTQEHKRD